MLELPSKVASPKLPKRERRGPSPFYAGFSTEFVREVLRGLDLAWPHHKILDPWAGSGTTVRVAAELKLPCVGVDINPAMVVAAKAGLVRKGETRLIRSQARHVSKRAERPQGTEPDDPLLLWFGDQAASAIRQLESSIRVLTGCPIGGSAKLVEMQPAVAALYRALFLVVRKRLGTFATSNPTWLKAPDPTQRLDLDDRDLRADFNRQVEVLLGDALEEGDQIEPVPASVILGSATQLPCSCKDSTLILTSPPYCTRIDYAVATRPELAVLGFKEPSQDELRRASLGTTTVPKDEPQLTESLGITALRLIEQVRAHESKASSTYYVKWLSSYLVEFHKSLINITHSSARGATAVLVVQDSYYKNIRINLAKITDEMMQHQGWAPYASYDYRVATTVAASHPFSRLYRSDFSARETALVYALKDDKDGSDAHKERYYDDSRLLHVAGTQ